MEWITCTQPNEDIKLQDFLVTRNALWKKQSALQMLKKGSNELRRDIKLISRQISQQRQIMYRSGLRTTRDSHFEKLDTVLSVLAEGIESDSGLEKSQELPVIWPDLVSWLHPKDSRVSSALAALRGLVTHATFTRSSTKNKKVLVFKKTFYLRKLSRSLLESEEDWKI
jgi:hypothetical protein